MERIREGLRQIMAGCQLILAAIEEREKAQDRVSNRISRTDGAGARQPNQAIRLPQPTGGDQQRIDGIEGRGMGGDDRGPPAEVGTGVAFDRSNRIELVGRSIESRERPLRGLSLDDRTIESIGTAREDQVHCDAVRFVANRIVDVLRPKRGRHWREDRKLIVTAAVLSLRFDELSTDRQAGQRWLQTALDAVKQFQPRNGFGYLTRCLQNGLRELDPRIGDQAAAAMIWIRLTRRLPIPEVWLAQPRQEADLRPTSGQPPITHEDMRWVRQEFENALRKAE